MGWADGRQARLVPQVSLGGLPEGGSVPPMWGVRVAFPTGEEQRCGSHISHRPNGGGSGRKAGRLTWAKLRRSERPGQGLWTHFFRKWGANDDLQVSDLIKCEFFKPLAVSALDAPGQGGRAAHLSHHGGSESQPDRTVREGDSGQGKPPRA